MAGFSLRLPEDLESRLDDEARREGVTRLEVARTAIAEFLEKPSPLRKKPCRSTTKDFA